VYPAGAIDVCENLDIVRFRWLVAIRFDGSVVPSGCSHVPSCLLYIYIYVYIYMYVYIDDISVYIYIYIHIYIYIYTR